MSQPIGPALTLAAIFPDGPSWAAQFFAGTEPAGALAGYSTQDECQAAAAGLLKQLGQRPQVVALTSREAARSLASTIRPGPAR